MKSNYGPVNTTQLRKETLAIATRLVNERECELRQKVQDSVAQQTLAVTMHVLAKRFGFGAKRLTELKNLIEDEFVIMHKKPLGKEYTALDLRDWLKEKYGVDLQETQYKGGID